MAAPLVLLIAACDHSDLRGHWSDSKDGNTYLVVADANCVSCPMLVDGKLWKYGVGVAGRIAPGSHKIENPGEIMFNVPAGTVYRFDYWGP
jgi:hypothetical protein